MNWKEAKARVQEIARELRQENPDFTPEVLVSFVESAIENDKELQDALIKHECLGEVIREQKQQDQPK